jgi:ankyrin repeat protein
MISRLGDFINLIEENDFSPLVRLLLENIAQFTELSEQLTLVQLKQLDGLLPPSYRHRIVELYSQFSEVGKIDYNGGLLACAAIQKKLPSNMIVFTTHDELIEFIRLLQGSDLHDVRYRYVVTDAHWIAGDLRLNRNGHIDHFRLDALGGEFELTNDYANMTFYFSKFKRQFNYTDCKAFALDDVKHLLTLERYFPACYQGENLFTYLSDPAFYLSGMVKENNVKINYIKLPLTFARTTQNMKVIADIMEQVDAFGDSTIVNKSGKKFNDSVRSSFEAIEYKGMPKVHNHRLQNKLAKMRAANLAYLCSTPPDVVEANMHQLTYTCFIDKTYADFKKQFNLMPDKRLSPSFSLHFVAISHDDVNEMKFWLDNGANIQALNAEGMTLLQAAIIKNSDSMVRLLLKYRASLSAISWSKLTPLHVAIYVRSLSICQLLVDYQVNVDAQDFRGYTALHSAVLIHSIELVNFLLSHHAKQLPDSLGVTPLHFSIKAKDTKLSRLLIKAGADINAKDNFGKSPLYYAVEEADIAMVAFLLRKGAMIDMVDHHGETAFFYAARNKDFKLLNFLLRNGANINACNMYGDTPLHVVVRLGQLASVEWLHNHGARTYIVNNEGKNVLVFSNAVNPSAYALLIRPHQQLLASFYKSNHGLFASDKKDSDSDDEDEVSQPSPVSSPI